MSEINKSASKDSLASNPNKSNSYFPCKIFSSLDIISPKGCTPWDNIKCTISPTANMSLSLVSRKTQSGFSSIFKISGLLQPFVPLGAVIKDDLESSNIFPKPKSVILNRK
eukprot:NODE_13_length_54415_cov_0.522424.p52 type:complete len:111 gc:universal NODE_13_length_54415_cov_0.522424:31622-31954(+)